MRAVDEKQEANLEWAKQVYMQEFLQSLSTENSLQVRH